MNIKLMNSVWMAKLPTHTMKLVLLALACHANHQGVAWISVLSIAVMCDLSSQCVFTQISKLKAAGFILVEYEGEGKPNRYTILLDSGD